MDLHARIIHEYHDAPVGATWAAKRLSRLSRVFFWPNMCKWVRNWICTCEICQRVNPSFIVAGTRATITDCSWSIMLNSKDFNFGLAPDSQDQMSILAFVDRLSKMTHLVPVRSTITAVDIATHFVDAVFRHHGLPENIVSDRDPQFASAFWTSLFEILGTKLKISTAAHP